MAIENRGGVERLSFKNTTFFVRGHKVIAVTLLQHGADTTIKNSNGKKMNGSLLCVLHDRDLKQTTIAAARGRGKKKKSNMQHLRFKRVYISSPSSAK